MGTMPEVLIECSNAMETMHLFEEDKESIFVMLNPIAQTYEVTLEIIQIIDDWIKIDISSKKYGDISKFITASKQLLPNKLIATSNIITHIIERLSKIDRKITFAESATGGLLSYYFTKENGASKVLDGALVTYADRTKENWLAIDHAILQEYSAISNETVTQMSDGALHVSNADYALAISGIAGDGGGTQERPVGTIHISIRTKDSHKEVELSLKGDRNYIQHQSVLEAIKQLLLIDKKVFF